MKPVARWLKARLWKMSCEHTGEIISDAECKARMAEAKGKGEPHFYMMELGQGFIIDARDRGTVARLINSSCDPNAESQKWHDAGTGANLYCVFILDLRLLLSGQFCYPSTVRALQPCSLRSGSTLLCIYHFQA